MRETEQPRPFKSIKTKLTKINPKNIINYLQSAHDALGHDIYNNDTVHDSEQVFYNPLDVEVSVPCSLEMQKFCQIPKFQKYRLSKLRTIARLPHTKSSKELLLGCIKRNMEQPLNMISNRKLKLVTKTVKEFLKNFCIPEEELLNLIEYYQQNQVSFSDYAFRYFRENKSDTYLKSIRNDPIQFEDRSIADYNLFMKGDLKTITEPMNEYDKIQTIVYHDRMVTCMFSSVFLEIKDRVKSILKKNVKYSDGMNEDQVEEWINNCNDFSLKKKYYLENDFSKYDKTQEETVYEIEFAIYRMLGMDETLIEAWKNGHIDTYIISRVLGIKIEVKYQRKSGDATTALGNFLVNLTTVGAVYKITSFVLAIFLGDDSLIILYHEPQYTIIAHIFLRDYNLIAKFEIFTTHGYFTSYFFFEYNGKYYSRYDPLKKLIKLGKVLKDDEKIEETFISYQDSVKKYDDAIINEELMKHVNERYKVELPLNLPDILFQLSTSLALFSTLYF